MKFALVFNPFSYKIHEENIHITQKYFGLFPPLSLAWIAAIAEKEPHRVVFLDSGFKGNDQLKTNAVQIMKTFDVESFRTV